MAGIGRRRIIQRSCRTPCCSAGGDIGADQSARRLSSIQAKYASKQWGKYGVGGSRTSADASVSRTSVPRLRRSFPVDKAETPRDSQQTGGGLVSQVLDVALDHRTRIRYSGRG